MTRATERAEGIHRLEVPTPFSIGTVNAYLICGDPLTLVDGGPAWTTALSALERAVAEHGARLEDIELVLITHHHVDHLGLARRVAAVSGAEVAALDLLAPVAANIESYLDEDDRTSAALMRRHGVPGEIVDVLAAVTRVTRHWAEPIRVGISVPHDGAIELSGGRLRVLHAPGHSPTDTLFVDEARGVAFVGDHLLAGVSSNALVGSRPPLEPAADRYRALLTYRESLRATRRLDVHTILTGHGPPIEDHRALIDARMAKHEQRAARILEILQSAPRSAYEIAGMMMGRRALTQAYLSVSSVLGHLDLLLRDGLVAEIDAGATCRFATI